MKKYKKYLNKWVVFDNGEDVFQNDHKWVVR